MIVYIRKKEKVLKRQHFSEEIKLAIKFNRRYVGLNWIKRFL